MKLLFNWELNRKPLEGTVFSPLNPKNEFYVDEKLLSIFTDPSFPAVIS